MALTNCRTGKYGFIESLEDWRIAELKKLGYHFGASWPDIAKVSLRSLLQSSELKEVRDSNPVYKEGIVFSDRTGKKGPILEAFLAYAKVKPKKIIFVDDKKEFLESVEGFAKQNNIEYIGIRYTKASDEEPDFEENIATMQYKILEEEKKWLSDSQARELLNRQSINK
jgi:hypothetical protein